MRIAFITPEFVTEPIFSGGLANYLGRVSVALANHGHDIHILTRSTNRDEPQIDYKGVTVHRVVPLWDSKMILDHVDPLVPRAHYNFYQDIKAAWCLRRAYKRLAKEMPFDLVQAANVSACGYFFRREHQTPVVTRLSSYRPLWDTMSGAEITRGLRMRWKFEQAAIEGTNYHYAPSHFVADETEKNYNVSDIDVVETPFFPEVPKPDDSVYRQRLAGKSYLLFFGRHTRMKGTHVLAQALPEVLESHPSLNAVFVGGDSDLAPGGGSMRDYILGQNERHRDRIHLLDPLRHDLLYPIIKQAHTVVIPSLADNLPNTCLEAMGLGKVVVAAKGSCFEQLITDGETGYLSEPGNPASLIKAITRSLSLSQYQRDSMGNLARQSLKRLHPDEAVPRLIDYYRQTIDDFQKKTNPSAEPLNKLESPLPVVDA